MHIAFYAPLKSPNHPVPSGDRLMARLLGRALERKGHLVEVVSELRSYSRVPDMAVWTDLKTNAGLEVARISERWRDQLIPDVWFCYHPYYKAPDLIGPRLAEEFGLAYVTAESSYAAKRDDGPWIKWQDSVRASLECAAINFCLTERDRSGILTAVPAARTASLKPFIDTAPFAMKGSSGHKPSLSLVSVAMMREGDKFDSYRFLAEALKKLPKDLPWTLSVIGDGPKAAEVKQLFADLPAGRVEWLGSRAETEVAELLAKASIYIWPGNGEAYGLAYLEAQAAGLPVIAQRIAGVPEVVADGVSGILTLPGDVEAYAGAIEDLLNDDARRTALAAKARDYVLERRSLDRAAVAIDTVLRETTGLI